MKAIYVLASLAITLTVNFPLQAEPTWCSLIDRMRAPTQGDSSPRANKPSDLAGKDPSADGVETLAKKVAKDPAGLLELENELAKASPDFKKISALLERGLAKGADPQALFEKITLLESKLSKSIPPNGKDLNIIGLIDELSKREGDPLGRAFDASLAACKRGR